MYTLDVDSFNSPEEEESSVLLILLSSVEGKEGNDHDLASPSLLCCISLLSLLS